MMTPTERCRHEIREYQRAHAAATPEKRQADAEIHKIGLFDWTIEELLIMQENETRTI
jgi:hypothetical protein